MIKRKRVEKLRKHAEENVKTLRIEIDKLLTFIEEQNHAIEKLLYLESEQPSLIIPDNYVAEDFQRGKTLWCTWILNNKSHLIPPREAITRSIMMLNYLDSKDYREYFILYASYLALSLSCKSFYQHLAPSFKMAPDDINFLNLSFLINRNSICFKSTYVHGNEKSFISRSVIISLQ